MEYVQSAKYNVIFFAIHFDYFVGVFKLNAFYSWFPTISLQV